MDRESQIHRTLLLAQRSKLFGQIQQIPFNCKISTEKSLQQILSDEDENFFVKSINIIFILAPFIIQILKKILREDPQLWGLITFQCKMTH